MIIVKATPIYFANKGLRQHSGFTLLEVLIAIAIFAWMSVVGFTLFQSIFIGDEVSARKNERLNELQRAFLVIERDITQITRRTVRFENESAKERYLHIGEEQTGNEYLLAFVRQGWKNPALMLPRGDLQLVAYQYNQEDKTLERLHFNYVDAVSSDDRKVRVLLTGVEAVHFEYFDGKTWQKDYQQSNSLPLAVAVVVTLADMADIRWQFLVAGQESAGSKTNG